MMDLEEMTECIALDETTFKVTVLPLLHGLCRKGTAGVGLVAGLIFTVQII